MRELVANVSIIAATIATLAFVIPQVVKLVRTGDTAGVSATWPTVGFAANVGWAVYFVHQELWMSIPAAVGALCGYLVTMWVLWRSGGLHTASLVRGAAFGALLTLATVLGGWTLLGVLLGCSFLAMMAPALLGAFAVPDPSGLAPGTWWLGVAEGALWGVYGWHHADTGLLVFATTAILGSIVMLWRYHSTRPGLRSVTSQMRV
jgi:uncharacterized protein with PQ loop repeat